jgi:aminomethyltransferase
LKSLGYYWFKAVPFQGTQVWVSRSGYTGEDGFEIFSPNALATPIWDRLAAAGEKEGILPAGLGARNTLRLEAGNALYGNDLDTSTTPLDAGLGWAVSFQKEGGFVGRDRLIKQKESGTARKLVAFRVLDKPIAREHYPIFRQGRKIGDVTSGSFSPTLGCNIGLGYVQRGADVPGTAIEIQVHGQAVPAEIVRRPFVPSKHKKGS